MTNNGHYYYGKKDGYEFVAEWLETITNEKPEAMKNDLCEVVEFLKARITALDKKIEGETK